VYASGVFVELSPVPQPAYPGVTRPPTRRHPATQHPAIQDVVGAALMAPALIPYEGWRLQHFNHLL
jgi:hypothetical protein